MPLRTKPQGHAWRQVHLLSNVERCTGCYCFKYTDAKTGKVGIGGTFQEATAAVVLSPALDPDCDHMTATEWGCGVWSCDDCGAELPDEEGELGL